MLMNKFLTDSTEQARSAYNDRHNGEFNKYNNIICFCIVLVP